PALVGLLLAQLAAEGRVPGVSFEERPDQGELQDGWHVVAQVHIGPRVPEEPALLVQRHRFQISGPGVQVETTEAHIRHPFHVVAEAKTSQAPALIARRYAEQGYVGGGVLAVEAHHRAVADDLPTGVPNRRLQRLLPAVAP